MKNIIYIAIFCLTLPAACVHKPQENNLDFEKVLRIDKSKLYSSGNVYHKFKSGEQIIIPSYVKMLTADSSEIRKSLKYEWILGNEVVSTQDTLKLSGYSPETYNGILKITDTRKNIIYSSVFQFSVEARYGEGFLIFAEKEGTSDIGMLSIHEKENKKGYDFSENIYSSSNKGAKFPSGILATNVHFYGIDNIGFDVVDPANGPTDLKVSSMQIIGNARKDFMGEPSFKIKDQIFVTVGEDNYVYALTDAGGVHVRKEKLIRDKNGEKIIPHASFFSSKPIVNSDGDLNITKWMNISDAAHSFAGIKHIMAYDEVSKGIVVINGMKISKIDNSFYADANEPHKNGKGWDGKREYPEITFPVPENLAGYKVLAINGSGFSMNQWGSGQLSVLLILERESDGKLFFFTYRYKNAWGETDINLDLFFPVPDEIKMDKSNLKICNSIGGENNFVYFTANNSRDIYYLNLISGNITKIYSCPEAISCIDVGQVANLTGELNIYGNKVIIGTEEGTIKVLEVTPDSWISGTVSEFCSFKTNMGKIKFVNYCNTQFANI